MPQRVAVEFIYVPIKVSLADTLLCQYTLIMSQPGTPPYKSLTSNLTMSISMTHSHSVFSRFQGILYHKQIGHCIGFQS